MVKKGPDTPDTPDTLFYNYHYKNPSWETTLKKSVSGVSACPTYNNKNNAYFYYLFFICGSIFSLNHFILYYRTT